MKIYTKTGDAGETGLFGGPRVRKDHARIEAFGTVDELNSHLGLIRTLPAARDLDALLRRIQCELFDLGAELATPGDAAERIGMQHVEEIEQAIDRYVGMARKLKAAGIEPVVCLWHFTFPDWLYDKKNPKASNWLHPDARKRWNAYQIGRAHV